jgi:hypothetical protein
MGPRKQNIIWIKIELYIDQKSRILQKCRKSIVWYEDMLRIFSGNDDNGDLATYISDHVTSTERENWGKGGRTSCISVCGTSSMGRKSKAQLAHLENLKKTAPNDYCATVEDATDSEDEFDDPDYNQTTSGTLHESSNLEREGSEGDFEEIWGQFILVEDDLSDDESDLDSEDGDWELNDEEEAEIKDEAALLSFSEVLRTGQELVTAAEKLKRGQKKHPWQYTKNSARTFRRRKGLREKLEATGQPSILAWI